VCAGAQPIQEGQVSQISRRCVAGGVVCLSVAVKRCDGVLVGRWLVGWLLVGCWLLVVGYWLLAAGSCWLLVTVGCWLVVCCWLLIVVRWLVAGRWLSAVER
jgi:hypothetical protein